MNGIELNILGCGSALPTLKHLPSTQVLGVRDKLMMIDCGEGVQTQMRKMQLSFSRVHHIFISHMHGDHCFGLPGLISTLGLLDKGGEVVIHAHSDAQKVFGPMIQYFCRDLPYTVKFVDIPTDISEVIFEDKSIKVSTLPLRHRVPATGFLFEEAQKLRHLRGDMLQFYNVPVYARNSIKMGMDFTTPEGRVIPNAALTTDADSSVRYAYCSDTSYSPALIPLIEGVDLLYHEATFMAEDVQRARVTGHSTSLQAATIARDANVERLIIGHYSSRITDEKCLLEQARTIFPNTELAFECMHVEL